MAIEAGDLQVKITADATGLQSGLDKAQNKLKSFEALGSAGFGKISTKAVAVGNIIAKAFTATFSAVSNQLNAAIQRFDTVNNFSNVMATMGNSASLSQSAINKLQDKLTGLPTTLNAAVAATQRLVASNDNLAASTDMFLALNNAIIAGTNDTNMQASALEQMLQAYAKGKPEMQDWKTLLQAMPAQLKQIATAMGYASTNELYEALQDGKITMNDFMATVMRLNSEGVGGFASFSEQARSNCNGVATAITNMKTAVARGLANIMDAIGQSNVAAFFNGITSAINTAMNYIAAFIRVVKVAVAWISTLFGGSGTTSNLVKETGSASENVGSIASGANNAADGLGKASKAAKALNKQLASFDEMNVLREQTSNDGGGSGGSGGSGGGANMSIPDYSWANEYASEASDKIEKIFQDMMNTLNGMFDFTTIKASIAQFVEDIKSAFSNVGIILGDVWESYIKPMISWTGNSLIPAILNAIGGAVRLLGEVLKTYWKSYLKPFIDNWLVPIAKWTGGKIVEILNNIGDGLRKISKNEDAVKLLTDALALLSSVIAGIKIANLVSRFNDAYTIFSMVKSATGDVSSAFGAVASNCTGLTQVIANLAGNGFTSLSNILGVVKTAVSSLWSVMSAHPILSIIAVIGALMLTNEEFRETLTQLLQTVLTPIMSILGSLMGLISQVFQVLGAALVDVLTPLISIAQLLAEGISLILQLFMPIIEILTEFIGIIGQIILTPLIEFFKGIHEVLSALLSPIMGFVNWLRSLFGATEDATDATKRNTEALSENDKQYDKNNDGVLQYNETLEKVQNTIWAMNNAEYALIKAQKEEREAVDNLKAYCDKYGKTQEQLIKLYDEGKLNTIAQDDALMDLFEAVVSVKEATAKVNSAQQEYTNSQEENKRAVMESAMTHDNELLTAYSEAGKKLVEIAKTTGTASDEYKNQKKVLEDLSKQLETVSASVRSVASWEEEATKAGRLFSQGYKNGMLQLQGDINNAAFSIGRSSTQWLKRGADEHSPSKLTRQAGAFFTEGFSLGIEDQSASVANAVQEIVDIAQMPIGKFVNSGFSLSADSSAIDDLTSNIDLEQTPVHVTVNVGDDTLIDRVVNGVNNLSLLRNKCVINV